MQTRDVVKVAKLAVQTRIYPLYEVINGKYILGKSTKKPKPAAAYLKLQGRFKHLTDQEIDFIQ